jgi:hypothetical protein
MESLLPDTIILTDEQFKTFLEKTILSENSRKLLAGLHEQSGLTTSGRLGPYPIFTSGNIGATDEKIGTEVTG